MGCLPGSHRTSEAAVLIIPATLLMPIAFNLVPVYVRLFGLLYLALPVKLSYGKLPVIATLRIRIECCAISNVGTLSL
jgi:hypothetical protein